MPDNFNPSNYIGEVTTSVPGDVVDVTPVIDTGAYADGDVLFAITELTDFFRVAGGKAVIDSVLVLCEDDEKAPFDIMFFRTTQNVGAANAALAVTDAEMREFLGHIAVLAADYKDWGDQSTAYYRVNDTGYKVGVLEAAAGSTSLFIAGVIRAIHTYTAATDIKIKISKADL